jgi:type II secretory pathway pseudopilin PulG
MPGGILHERPRAEAARCQVSLGWPAAHGTRPPRGVIYPVLLISILVIGVATAGVAQLWSTQVGREKEEELLFRLGEIRRAIVRYRADHNRLPKELKDLLEDRTQLQTRRYLRRIYTDPMTGKPDWKPDLLADRTGIVTGIQDVHSRAEGKPLKVFGGKQVPYKEW